MSRDSKAKQIHLRSNYDHCSSIEINCIASQSLSFASRLKWTKLMECWLLPLIIDSTGHCWPMRGLRGLALTNQRPPPPLASAAYWPIWCANVVVGMDPTFLGQIHIKTWIPVTQAAPGLRKHYSHSVNKSSVKFYLGNLCLVTLLPYWDFVGRNFFSHYYCSQTIIAFPTIHFLLIAFKMIIFPSLSLLLSNFQIFVCLSSKWNMKHKGGVLFCRRS